MRPRGMDAATTGDGVAALVDAIDAHRAAARSPVQATARARNQVRRALADLALRHAGRHAAFDATLESVANRQLDPISAAERLLGEGPKS